MQVTTTHMSDAKVETELFSNMSRLKELRVAHRDLDDVIARLSEDPLVDQLQLRRLGHEIPSCAIRHVNQRALLVHKRAA